MSSNLLNQFLGYVKTFFTGVYYILTLQWGKAWKIAKGGNKNNDNQA